MTRDDIIHMAREAGWTEYSLLHAVELQRLETFAALVAAAEREKFIDYPKGEVCGPCICGSWPGGDCLRCPPTEEYLAAIRARGEVPR
jgi:hypothetical protein